MTSEQLLLVQVTKGLSLLLTAAATEEALTALAAIQAAQVPLQSLFDEAANPPEVAVLDPDLPVDAQGVTPEVTIVDERVRARNLHAVNSGASDRHMEDEVEEPPPSVWWDAMIGGIGSIEAPVTVRMVGSATFGGVGLIAADGGHEPHVPASAGIDGSGLIEVDATQEGYASALIEGAGLIDALADG